MADVSLIMMATGTSAASIAATTDAGAINSHATDQRCSPSAVGGSDSRSLSNHTSTIVSTTPPQQQSNAYGVTINNRTLINVQSSSAAPDDAASQLNQHRPAAQHNHRQLSGTPASSIEEKWYSLPLRWRTHPSASVERPRQPPTKQKKHRHSWHVSSAAAAAADVADETAADVDVDSGSIA